MCHPPLKTLWIIKWRGPTVTLSWMFVFEEKLLKKLNHSQRIKIRKPQSFLKMFYTRKSSWKPVSVCSALSLEIRDLRAESRAESDQEKVLSRKLGLTWAKTKYFSRTENIFQQNSVKNLKEFGLTGPWILIFELVGRRMIDVFL